MSDARRRALVLGPLVTVSLLVAAAVVLHLRAVPLPGRAYRVVRVVDGDTIVVSLAGHARTVRLIGVDTPEVVDPRRPVQYYGKEASACTHRLLDERRVFLENDGPNPAEDRYGRLLAYVYRAPDKLFVNLELVRQGYGHAYTKYPFGRMEEFRAAEREAREAERGLWGKERHSP